MQTVIVRTPAYDTCELGTPFISELILKDDGDIRYNEGEFDSGAFQGDIGTLTLDVDESCIVVIGQGNIKSGKVDHKLFHCIVDNVGNTVGINPINSISRQSSKFIA